MARGRAREESPLNPGVLLRHIIAALTLAGAAVGLATSARHALAGEITGIGWPVSAAFVFLYCVGLTAGILLLRARPHASGFALAYWIAQVPVFASPLLAYYFGAGAAVYVTVGAGEQVDLAWFIGTHFGVSVGTDGGTAVGLNVVALAVVTWLLAFRRKARRTNHR